MNEQKQKNALKILINGVNIAAKRGAFSLAEAKIIAEAVDVFVKKLPTPQPTKDKKAAKKKKK